MTDRRPIDLDIPVVLALCALLAGCSVLILFHGAGLYRQSAYRDNLAIRQQTLQQYLDVKIKRAGTDGAYVAVGNLSGEIQDTGPVLMLYENINDTTYRTAIYVHRNTLYELTSDAGLNFAPGDGQAVMPLSHITLTRTGSGVVVNAEFDTGDRFTFYIASLPGETGGGRI